MVPCMPLVVDHSGYKGSTFVWSGFLFVNLQSLGLAVEAVNEGGDIVKFGKDEEKQHPPKMDTGLLGIGDNLITKR